MSSQKLQILIIPGIDGQPDLRQEIVFLLQDRFSISLASLPDSVDMDYEALARHIAERLPEGPLVLVGESFGGPLAALIARDRPDVVVGLVLIASFVKLSFPSRLRSLVRFIPFQFLPFRPLAWLLIGNTAQQRLVPRLKAVVTKLPDALLKHRLRLALSVDARQVLRELPHPVLVVHGRHDKLVPKRQVRRLSEIRPDLQICMLDGSHMILETHAASVASAISAFVDRLGSR